MLAPLSRLVLPVCAVALAIPVLSRGQTKTSDAQRLVVASGGDAGFDATVPKIVEMMVSIIRPQIVSAAQQHNREIPPQLWDDIRAILVDEIRARKQFFLDLVTPLYEKHFTAEEIRDLLAFYDSPVGKKLATAYPRLVLDSMNLGEKWGRDSGEPIMKNLIVRLDAKGYFSLPRIPPKPATQPRSILDSKKDESTGRIAQDDANTVFRVGNGVTAPTVLYKIDPEYSEEAHEAKINGTVVLYLEVDTTGNARNVRVVKGLGLGLDEKATEAVMKWRFKPGLKDGRPVVTAAHIEVKFSWR